MCLPEPDDVSESPRHGIRSKNTRKIVLPTYVYSAMCTISTVDSKQQLVNVETRTDLDSHANMPVIGKHALILSHTGRVADVNPFTPDYESMRVPIVHAAL
eukprot:13043059-Ditylum_brightwellii.AAC.1